MKQKADGVEVDVRLTSDNRVICHHDKNTKRTTGEDKLVAETTYKELKTLDCGSWFGKPWFGSQVKNFWERIGSENPRQIAISSTHPATAERYLQIEKTVEEIKKKKNDGLALVPNEKELKTEKKETKKKKKFDLKKLIKKKE